MKKRKVIWPQHATFIESNRISDAQVFSLIEYSYERIAYPIAVGFHGRYWHYHYDYDQARGRQDFAREVNRLFKRNGLAFRLRRGKIKTP
jgi:hypothetical protein